MMVEIITQNRNTLLNCPGGAGYVLAMSPGQKTGTLDSLYLFRPKWWEIARADGTSISNPVRYPCRVS